MIFYILHPSIQATTIATHLDILFPEKIFSLPREMAMLSVYIEPVPKGRWGPIDGYSLEFQDGTKITEQLHQSETLAVREIRLRGYLPLKATVRITDKAVAEHWQLAEETQG